MNTDLRLPRIFSDHLVLHYQGAASIWGWGTPGRTITVAYRDRSAQSIIDSKGTWRCRFTELGLGEPGPLRVTDGFENVEIQDVVTGEVWLCGGQSNMEWPVSLSDSGQETLKTAEVPNIRFLSILKVATVEEQVDQDAVWCTCSPDTASEFSAIGFFYGRIRHQSAIPIGLINANWGASSAEAWIPRVDLQAHPTLCHWLQETLQERELALPAHTEWQKRVDHRGSWMLADPGIASGCENFAAPDLNDSDWTVAKIGVRWRDFDPPININGAVWYRTEFHLPVGFEGPGILSLGLISDFETVYVNGVVVGQTSEEQPGAALDKRIYLAPAEVLRGGSNVLAIRVFARIEEGGLISPQECLWLRTSDNIHLPLNGSWRCKVEFEDPTLGWPNWSSLDQCLPSGPWGGMIAPITPFGLTGVLWYQGESNTDRAPVYLETLQLLIRSWRREFEQEGLRFLIVQLANYGSRSESPGESNWAQVREAQWVAASEHNVATAVAIDLGEGGDIHPRRKLPVAQRLALACTALESGEERGNISPHLVSARVVEDGLAIELALSELVHCVDGTPPLAFSVLNEHGVWEWGNASISGTSIVVRSATESQVVAARYAWADNPLTNLYSEGGLPLAPFRTDS